MHRKKKNVYIIVVFIIATLIFSIVFFNYLQEISNSINSYEQYSGDPMMDVVDPENPPPTCSISENSNSQGVLQVMVRDDAQGIGEITVIESENVNIEIPEFNTNENNLSPKLIVVTVSKIDQSKSSYAVLEMVDIGGSKSVCTVD